MEARAPGPGAASAAARRSATATAPGERARKALTIGAVCKLLRREFPDISISKIRYLEDQKLLSPRRTQGGYRLYSPADVSRLRTILRLQRDEFLPLRVIRQELAAGRTRRGRRTPRASSAAARGGSPSRRRPSERHSLDAAARVRPAPTSGWCASSRSTGCWHARGRGGERGYDAVEREIVRVGGELTRYGVAPRNLRVFRTSADREAALLEQILGPALRSRNRERRKRGGRGPREPGRGRVAAQAPAARAGPAQAGPAAVSADARCRRRGAAA